MSTAAIPCANCVKARIAASRSPRRRKAGAVVKFAECPKCKEK